MNKKLIKDDYKKKLSQIKIYNKNYYDKSKSLISDQEYDHLKKGVFY